MPQRQQNASKQLGNISSVRNASRKVMKITERRKLRVNYLELCLLFAAVKLRGMLTIMYKIIGAHNSIIRGPLFTIACNMGCVLDYKTLLKYHSRSPCSISKLNLCTSNHSHVAATSQVRMIDQC